MGDSADLVASIRTLAVPLLAPYVRRVFLFGSAATGEETATSDVDILVELKPASKRPPLGLRWFGLERELGVILGRAVDLVSDDALSPRLRPYVERQKILVYAEG
jgi:predicted nucleotidyltransferase